WSSDVCSSDLEHQLDRHEHDQQVLPREEAGRADGEQDRRDDVVVRDRDHRASFPSPRRATTMTPIIATSSSRDAISKGNRYSPKKILPISPVDPERIDVPAAVEPPTMATSPKRSAIESPPPSMRGTCGCSDGSFSRLSS